MQREMNDILKLYNFGIVMHIDPEDYFLILIVYYAQPHLKIIFYFSEYSTTLISVSQFFQWGLVCPD